MSSSKGSILSRKRKSWLEKAKDMKGTIAALGAIIIFILTMLGFFFSNYFFTRKEGIQTATAAAEATQSISATQTIEVRLTATTQAVATQAAAATADAFVEKYRAILGSDLEINESRGALPSKILDAISEKIGSGEEIYYLWQRVVNKNAEPASCVEDIKIEGPVYTINTPQGTVELDLGKAQQLKTLSIEIFPADVSIEIVADRNITAVFLGQKGEKLWRNSSLHSPIVLFFYGHPQAYGAPLCGKTPLNIPLGAFRYVEEEDTRLHSYLFEQLDLLGSTILLSGQITPKIVYDRQPLIAYVSVIEGDLLVASWWTTGNEAAGLDTILAFYEDENPGVELVDVGITSGAGTDFKAAALASLAAGEPLFDVFQLRAGREVELYSPEIFLTPLDDLLTETGMLKEMPEGLQELLKVQNNIYTVPLNVRRGNVMWTNTRLLEQANVAVPTNFEEFFVACQTLQDQGIVPLAMGTASGFELSHIFEVVLAGTVGAEMAKGLWNGTVSWTDRGVIEALENFSKLLDCTNDDRAAINWAGAIDLVINDQAAFSIMGDWVYDKVIAQGALDRVTWSLPPGNQDQFLLVSDSFAIPKEAPNPENAQEFVRLITRKEVQETFNQETGSICARTDCDYSNFSEDRRAYFQAAATDFAEDAIIPMATHGSAAIPSWQADFNQIITRFAIDRDIVAAQTAFVLAAEDAGFPQ